MTLKELDCLSINQIKKKYDLSKKQYNKICASVHCIYDTLRDLKEKRSKMTEGVYKEYQTLKKDGIDYPILYKGVKSKNMSLWTENISREAYREYYRSIINGKSPRVTAEHYWNRARVIHEIINGEWGDIILEYGATGFIWLYFEGPCIGQFHITTEKENTDLKKYQKNFSLSWREQYNNVDIELFTPDIDINWAECMRAKQPITCMFTRGSVGFWKEPYESEVMEDLVNFNIDVSDIDREFRIKTLV